VSPCYAEVQGRDTRPSSPHLVAVAAEGIAAVGVRMLDLGLVTTPQLHFLVRACNKGQPYTENDYYSTLAGGYRSLVGGGSVDRCGVLILDAANGVGGAKWRALAAWLEGALPSTVEVRNDGTGQLNELVGADFVQKQQKPPLGVAAPADAGCR
jgi:phosphoacetylglucosamine mutase